MLSLSRLRRQTKKCRPFYFFPHLEVLEDRRLLALFTVTTTDDSGPGSFRQAILDSNSTPEKNTIAFAIGNGGVQTIQLLSPLPDIVQPVVIDGTTQPGYNGRPLIVLQGAGTNTNGLVITSGDSTVKGLVINHFSLYGLHLIEGGGNVISGNYIGTDVTGTQAVGNGIGIAIVQGSSNNIIGGTVPAARNLISGNATGIGIGDGATGNQVQGNFIGTDFSGTAVLGNHSFGVIFDTISRGTAPTKNTIGGTVPGARNLISGNLIAVDFENGDANAVQGNYIGSDITGMNRLANYNGIATGTYNRNPADNTDNTIGGSLPGAGNLISGNSVYGIAIARGTRYRIEGNYIGVNAMGTAAMPNDFVGLVILDDQNTVGGSDTGAGNVISGNRYGGIFIVSQENIIRGNRIGVSVHENEPLGNGGKGIAVFLFGEYFGNNNLIGGTNPGDGNLIAFNQTGGISISQVTGNGISRNSIFSNQGPGIQLTDGGNNMLPAPVLISAVSLGGFTSIEGTLASTPNTTFTIELFLNSVCDPSGFGQGERFISSLTEATDSEGMSAFSLTLPGGLPPGEFLTATATDPAHNTSEFSACIEIAGGSGPRLPFLRVADLVSAPRFLATFSNIPDPTIRRQMPANQTVDRLSLPSSVRSSRSPFDRSRVFDNPGTWPAIDADGIGVLPCLL